MSKDTKRFIENITVGGKVFEYMMTSDTEVLRTELEPLGCRLPNSTDYRYNPSLSEDVRKKMVEHDAKWSLTTSNGCAVLNYYRNNETPFIIYLSELISLEHVTNNYSRSLMNTLRKLGDMEKTGISSEWSVLMIAISQRKTEIVRYFVENGADVNYADSNGVTPLMLAVFVNEVEIMHILIENGAEVNARSKNGFSALIYALWLNSMDAIKLLTENGANLNISIAPKVYDEKKTFLETLNFYIAESTLCGAGDISRIYKKSGMSKQTFSKIRSTTKSTYHPKKESVIQLAIGMRLTLAQTENLLNSAGYFLEDDNPVDQIIKAHINHLDFDMMKINDEVYEKTGKPFLREEKEIPPAKKSPAS